MFVASSPRKLAMCKKCFYAYDKLLASLKVTIATSYFLVVRALFLCFLGINKWGCFCYYVRLSELNVPKQLGYKLVGDNIDKGVKARYIRKGTHLHD